VYIRGNLEQAVTGNYPNYALDFSKIVLSNPAGVGEIDGGFAPTAVPATGSVVSLYSRHILIFISD